MKTVTVFFALLVGGASCDSDHHHHHRHHSYVHGQPRKHCAHGLNAMSNGAMAYGAATQHFKTEEEPASDTNPSKIPSLMDPSTSVGFLESSEIDLADRCFPEPKCDSSAKFRTVDGSCNNLRFPVWGKSHTANIRIIQAHYSDGKSQPRKAVSGRELPNVRRIRKAIFKDVDRPSSKHNLFVMQFGQIVAHDTELTPLKSSGIGEPLKCCNSDGTVLKNLPKGCLPTKLAPNESGSKKRCLSAPRGADTSDLGCQIRPVRQQIGVTSFVDASLLYGSDDDTASGLRTFTNGKLRMQMGYNGQPYLPNVKNATEVCKVDNDNSVCYVSGDRRVNQHPDMAVTTTSLMRLHNHLCESFKKINPKWDDQRLYQEARRLLIAMYQHVTYNEFVPILIGRDYARVNHLLPLSEGFDDNYDQALNPTTISSFTSAAYRSLHSQVQGFVDLVSEARKTVSTIRLSDSFFNVDIVQKKDNYDSLTRGMLTQSTQKQDKFFTDEVSEFLFKVSKDSDGFDLISLDLERGRDFGEPSYNRFRQLCGLDEAKTFDDFTDQISKKDVDVLADLYENVNDVDYFAAGLLEKSKPGAILGHTFQCVVGEMFFRWKFGDRFFYEFGDQPGSFTPDQLKEIRKSTLALIVCMTSNIVSIQRHAFNVPSSRNPLVHCNSIPKLDLTAWKKY